MGDWVNERAPGMMPMYRKHMTEYYAPKNFNLWYYFGSLAILVLVNQIVTGIFLTMNYKTSAAEAFASVEYIMRDVEWGWLIRYMHSTGASLFFIVVFLHMFRGLMYGSYKKPRELVWILGMLIFLVLMAEAFMGYVLPWGNMSFWGAKVIISLFGTIPYIGDDAGAVDHGRLHPGRRHAQPLLRAARDRAAAGAVAAGGAAHRRAARSGFEQPRWRRDQEGSQGQPLGCAEAGRRHSVPSVLHGEGSGRRRLLPADRGVHHLLRADLRRLVPRARQLHSGQQPGDAVAHQAGVVLHPVLRDLAHDPVVLRHGGLGRAGHVRRDRACCSRCRGSIVGKVKSIRYRGTGYKVALGLFVVSFIMLGAVGAGMTAEVIPEWFGDIDVTFWENLFGRVMTLIYFGFFVFLWALHLFRLGNDQAGSGTGDDA